MSDAPAPGPGVPLAKGGGGSQAMRAGWETRIEARAPFILRVRSGRILASRITIPPDARALSRHFSHIIRPPAALSSPLAEGD